MAAEFGLNWLDRLIEPWSPQSALKRLHARAVLASYEAAVPSRLRKFRGDKSGPNRLAEKGAVALRTQMRYLERNHDITKGSLDVLVNNTVGPNGIGVEFQPRKMDGSIHEDYAQQLADAYEDWQRRPEVTHRRDWQAVQRVVARSKFRDGEVFAQRISGPLVTLDHGTRVPYSLELMEADLIPYEVSDQGKGIFNGCEINEWGRVRAWHCYKRHPGELMNLPTIGDVKRIPAERMLQVAELGRIGQLRGITPYASVINRIEDIKDYEESERVAAKIAARMGPYIKKLAPSEEGYTPTVDANGNPAPRELSWQVGQIYDQLYVGEEIGMIDTNRPNPNLITFRSGQLRAFAAGIAASYSSVSRNYEGTYSAQRQELVETFVHYAVHTDDFVGQFNRPVIEDFITTADLSAVARKPRDLKPGSEFDVLYLAPSMPWIDPAKEALAWLTLVQAGFASEVEVIRKRGQSPESVLEQVALWRTKCEDKGLSFNSDAGMKVLLEQQAADENAKPEDRAQAKAMLAAVRKGADPLALVAAAMSRPQPTQQAPVVNVAAPVVTVEPAAVQMRAGDTHVHLDKGMVDLHASVDAPISATIAAQHQHDAPVFNLHSHPAAQARMRSRVPERDKETGLITAVSDGHVRQVFHRNPESGLVEKIVDELIPDATSTAA
jgi:lambda family phage portal protein